jgi:hypothetical protein
MSYHTEDAAIYQIPFVGPILQSGAQLLGFGAESSQTNQYSSPFMSFANPGYGEANISMFPSMSASLGGGQYSTGLDVTFPDSPGGYHDPLQPPGPVPGIEQTTSLGFAPGAGGTMVPYTYETTGVEAAYPEYRPQTNLMERIVGIGSEALRLENHWSVPDEEEGVFRTGQGGDWEDRTDDQVAAAVSALSEEDRKRYLPEWTAYAMVEDVQNSQDYTNFRNEQIAASSMDEARTTANTMGMLTGMMGMSEYADIIQRSQQMGEKLWGDFRNRGYDTSTAYASAGQAAEQAKGRMMGEFFDRQLSRRLGTLQMSNNIMQQAFMGVQRTPPDPMAIAQIIYQQVAGGSGQQMPTAGNPFIAQTIGAVIGAYT